MANKDKLLLLATIYMLLPGAAALDAQAADAESEKPKTKRSAPVQQTQLPATARRRSQKKALFVKKQ